MVIQNTHDPQENMTFSALRTRCRRESDYIVTLLFTNEISLLITWALIGTRVTPNQVTAASLACGLFCGLFFFQGWFTAGAFFLFMSHLLDCTDGNLARARQEFSDVGRWLDFVGDKVADVMLFLGTALYFFRTADATAWVLLPVVDGLFLMLYYYIVDVGLSLGVSEKKQNLTRLRFKGVHVKWGLMEPVIYGFVILAPLGLIKVQLVGLFFLVITGLAYQIVKNYRTFSA
jgi:phosphatidylglycerophosphate synthase